MHEKRKIYFKYIVTRKELRQLLMTKINVELITFWTIFQPRQKKGRRQQLNCPAPF